MLFAICKNKVIAVQRTAETQGKKQLDKFCRKVYLINISHLLSEFFFLCFTQSAVSAGNYQMIRIFKQFYLQRRIVYGSKIEGVFPDDSGKGGVTGGDSMRIADETSLLITDIVVELEDGSIANVEMQKIGYLFPGQRCACYSADLLLRQYKRVRGERKRSSAIVI